MSDEIMGVLRHALTVAGGALVTNGYLTGAQEQDVAGALAVIIGVAWSIWSKRAKA